MMGEDLIQKRLILLSKLYAILGVLGVLVSVLMGIGAGVAFFKGDEPHDVQVVLNVVSFAGVIGSLLLSTGLLYVSRWVRCRKNHASCVVVSALMLPALPFGTAVGVYALYVLLDAQVRKQFLR